MVYTTVANVLIFSQVDWDQLGFADAAALNTFVTDVLIPKAEEVIDSFIGHDFNMNIDQTVTLDGTGKRVLFIPTKYCPMLGLGTVTINGVEVTVGDIKVHDQFVEYDGGSFTSGKLNIALIGSYGYNAVPADVQYVTDEICSNVLLDLVRRRVAPEHFMPALTGGSEAGLRILFAGPTAFPKTLQDMIDKYRITWVDVG